MRTRRRTRHHAVVSTLAMSLGLAGIFVAGCGEGGSVVGGECVSGYAPCGGTCCPSDPDSSTGISAHPDGGREGGPSDSGGDGDGAPRTHGDGSVDADSGHAQADASSGGGSDASTGSDGSSPGDDGGAGDEGSATGDDGTAPGDDGGAAGDDGGGGSGSDAGGLSCTPPLVDCGGVCVDITDDDPLNCGACGVQCPSEICQNSQCVGSTAGGVVFIGHDFALDPASPGPAAVLSNAIFEPRNNPLRVMSYERHAKPVAVASVDAVMFGWASLLGRQLSFTSTVDDDDVPAKLLNDSYDVLVVHDQASAAPGDMAALGASWSSTLTTFTAHYGIVIILSGGTGVGEMPQFSTGTGLLLVTAQSLVAVGTPLQVLAPGDAIGLGVVSPYAASASSVFLTTEPNGGNVAYVVGGMNGVAGPVVVHKVF